MWFRMLYMILGLMSERVWVERGFCNFLVKTLRLLSEAIVMYEVVVDDRLCDK